MIAAALLVAQYVGTLDLADTTRVAGRATQPPQTIGTPPREEVVIAMDVATSATVRLGLHDRRWDYALGYTPTVTAADVELGFAPQLLQAATASVAWHDPRWRVVLSESASFGLLNSAFLYSNPASASQTQPGQGAAPTTMGANQGPMSGAGGMTTSTGLQSVPQPHTITFGASNSSANIAFRASRRATLTLLGGFSFGGGLGTDAQTYLPLQENSIAGTTLAYSLSKSDRLSFATTASWTTTSGACPPGLGPAASTIPGAAPPNCTEQVPSVQVQATINHELTSASAVSVAGGVSALVGQAPGLEELVIVPTVSSTYTQTLGALAASRLSVNAQLAPTVDLLTGLPSTRVQVGASLSKTVLRALTVGLVASGARSIPVPVRDLYPITLFGGGLTVAWQLERQLALSAGLNELWQNEAGYPTFSSTIAYVSATTSLPTVRF